MNNGSSISAFISSYIIPHICGNFYWEKDFASNPSELPIYDELYLIDD